MKNINEIADGYYREAEGDYIGLWAITGAVEGYLGLSNKDEVKARTLDVVRLLLDRGLVPGDYLKTGFHFWNERDPASIIARIDREWDPVRGEPNLADPICWFAMKRQWVGMRTINEIDDTLTLAGVYARAFSSNAGPDGVNPEMKPFVEMGYRAGQANVFGKSLNH
jgi:hypothetical protein